MGLQKLLLSGPDGASRDFYIRQDSVGDKGVVQQIFFSQDYETKKWAHDGFLRKFYDESRVSGVPLIVDAGANIGASTAFYLLKYPGAAIFSIEPEKNNLELLKINCEGSGVEIFSGGIAASDGIMFLHDPGGSDWSFRLVERGEISVPVISLGTILANKKDDSIPFILKIDIEGGERLLFSKNTEWLDSFALVVIELHDWLFPLQQVSKDFFKAIAKYDFDVIAKGENFFCFNRRLLSKYL